LQKITIAAGIVAADTAKTMAVMDIIGTAVIIGTTAGVITIIEDTYLHGHHYSYYRPYYRPYGYGYGYGPYAYYPQPYYPYIPFALNLGSIFH